MSEQRREQASLTQDEAVRLLERTAEVEAENDRLAHLYVASHQLHSTLDLSEVLRNIVEIAINLVGAEQVAVYVLDEPTGRLEPVACEEADPARYPSFDLGEGAVGSAVASGQIFRADRTAPEAGAVPIACIPLRIQERPLGALVIYRLVEHKGALTRLDEELFTLVAGHCATAILAARLYAESERKLNTMQGFLDLLTK
jgi:GAF domain-containing protein